MLAVPPSLRAIDVASGCAPDYDRWLGAGAAKMDVSFDIDANCLLVVTARVVTAGDQLPGRERCIEIKDVPTLGGPAFLEAQRRFEKSEEHQE